MMALVILKLFERFGASLPPRPSPAHHSPSSTVGAFYEAGEIIIA